MEGAVTDKPDDTGRALANTNAEGTVEESKIEGRNQTHRAKDEEQLWRLLSRLGTAGQSPRAWRPLSATSPNETESETGEAEKINPYALSLPDRQASRKVSENIVKLNS